MCHIWVGLHLTLSYIYAYIHYYHWLVWSIWIFCTKINKWMFANQCSSQLTRVSVFQESRWLIWVLVDFSTNDLWRMLYTIETICFKTIKHTILLSKHTLLEEKVYSQNRSQNNHCTNTWQGKLNIVSKNITDGKI